jgi:hypothetical protein
LSRLRGFVRVSYRRKAIVKGRTGVSQGVGCEFGFQSLDAMANARIEQASQDVKLNRLRQRGAGRRPRYFPRRTDRGLWKGAARGFFRH